LTFKLPVIDGTYLPRESDADLEQVKRMIQEQRVWQNEGGTLQESEHAKGESEEIMT